MLSGKTLKRAAAIFATAALGAISTAAIAEPGSGVTPTNFVNANFDETTHVNSDRVKFQTKDATDVRVQQLVFAAGGRSGWHHHPGVLVVAVASGLVTLTDSSCKAKSYGPGSPNGAVFVEGGDEPVQASSAAGATVYVTTITPDGEAPRIEDDPISCASASTFRTPPKKR